MIASKIAIHSKKWFYHHSFSLSHFRPQSISTITGTLLIMMNSSILIYFLILSNICLPVCSISGQTSTLTTTTPSTTLTPTTTPLLTTVKGLQTSSSSQKNVTRTESGLPTGLEGNSTGTNDTEDILKGQEQGQSPLLRDRGKAKHIDYLKLTLFDLISGARFGQRSWNRIPDRSNHGTLRTSVQLLYTTRFALFEPARGRLSRRWKAESWQWPRKS